jgi:AraC-like DNA-binding protein
MIYQEYLPSDDLKNFIKNYWCFEINDRPDITFPLDHETLPDSEVSIVFINTPEYKTIRLLGPHTKKFNQRIYPDSVYFGIRLLPWLSFTPAIFNKAEILNATSDCPISISKHFSSLKIEASVKRNMFIRKVENGLSKLFSETLSVSRHELIRFICLELFSGKSVGNTLTNIPVSVRVVQKRFKEVVGMTMREYHSINRQRNLWTDLVKNQTNKTDLIHKYSFYDQAHFINDFRKKMKHSHVDFEKYIAKIDHTLP